jgi:uncharacterized DUF497 family protein/uncharacterized protein (DUF4415 family)
VQFEWDEVKNAANRKKHHLDFETATRVFDDPNFVLVRDRVDEDGEQRWHAIGFVGGMQLSMVVHVYRGLDLARKSYASSQPEKLIRVRAEDIFRKPLTKRQEAMLCRLADMPDSAIDYSDIPPLTDEQLATAIRGRDRKQLVTARLDPDVLEWLKSLGGPEGYSTRINNILRAVMNHSR